MLSEQPHDGEDGRGQGDERRPLDVSAPEEAEHRSWAGQQCQHDNDQCGPQKRQRPGRDQHADAQRHDDDEATRRILDLLEGQHQARTPQAQRRGDLQPTGVHHARAVQSRRCQSDEDAEQQQPAPRPHEGGHDGQGDEQRVDEIAHETHEIQAGRRGRRRARPAHHGVVEGRIPPHVRRNRNDSARAADVLARSRNGVLERETRKRSGGVAVDAGRVHRRPGIAPAVDGPPDNLTTPQRDGSVDVGGFVGAGEERRSETPREHDEEGQGEGSGENAPRHGRDR